MAKILFDSHCHISDEAFLEEKESFIKEIESSDLKIVMDIGASMQTTRTAVESAETYDFCYATAGVHPSEVGELTEADMEELRSYAAHPKVVALGEMGLDYKHDDDPAPEIQQYWFGRQIDLANELKMPIVVHSRMADADTLRVLKEHGAFSKERISAFPPKPDGSPDARVLIHCFSQSVEMAKEYVKLGASLAIGGPVTWEGNRNPAESVKVIDLVHLLVETDSPYLTPEPFRGHWPNKPMNVEYTARKVAELKGISYEEVAKATYENACRFYGIKC